MDITQAQKDDLEKILALFERHQLDSSGGDDSLIAANVREIAAHSHNDTAPILKTIVHI